MTKTLMSSKDVTGVDTTGLDVATTVAAAALSVLIRTPRSSRDVTGVDTGLVVDTTVIAGAPTTVDKVRKVSKKKRKKKQTNPDTFFFIS